MLYLHKKSIVWTEKLVNKQLSEREGREKIREKRVSFDKERMVREGEWASSCVMGVGWRVEEEEEEEEARDTFEI